MSLGFSFVVLAIFALLALTTWLGRNRSATVKEEENPDYHVLRAEYQSGIGGGSSRTWKVPKDPQEYAKFFAPSPAKGKIPPRLEEDNKL
jgi:hypothetical protein